jgi:hypothetical protein
MFCFRPKTIYPRPVCPLDVFRTFEDTQLKFDMWLYLLLLQIMIDLRYACPTFDGIMSIDEIKFITFSLFFTFY